MNNVTHLPTSSTSTRAAPISWVEKLFERMQALYGNKFIDMWRDTNIDLVKDMWAEEMGKLNADELRRGFTALMARDWPPTLPEYLRMCRPPIDASVAFYEALNGIQARELGEMGKWSHPAIFWATTRISPFDMKNQSYPQLKTRWEQALAEEMEKGQWPDIPVPRIGLPAPGKSELSKEKAEQMIHELKAEGVVKTATQANDPLRWAKRILERVRNGDKTVSMIQRKFAEEAMGVRK